MAQVIVRFDGTRAAQDTADTNVQGTVEEIDGLGVWPFAGWLQLLSVLETVSSGPVLPEQVQAEN